VGLAAGAQTQLTTLSLSLPLKCEPTPQTPCFPLLPGARAGHDAHAGGRRLPAVGVFAAVHHPNPNPYSQVRVLDTTPTLAGAGCPLWVLPPQYTTVPLLPVGDTAAAYHVMQSPGGAEPTLTVDAAGRVVTVSPPPATVCLPT
jgi:hypothetical protein